MAALVLVLAPGRVRRRGAARRYARHRPATARVPGGRGTAVQAGNLAWPRRPARRAGPSLVRPAARRVRPGCSRLPASSMSAAVALPGQGSWSGAQGSAEPLYAWASAGKQAIAAVVLQLADEGRLSLSDTLARRLPTRRSCPMPSASPSRNCWLTPAACRSANEVRAAACAVPTRSKRSWISCATARTVPARRLLALLELRLSAAGRHHRPRHGPALAGRNQARVIDRLGLRHMRVVTDAASLVGVAPPSTADGSPALDLAEPGAAGALLASAADMVRSSRRCWMGSC